MSTSTTAQGRENAAAGFTAQATLMSLHTADPGATGASEVAGGSPAYARKTVTWTAGAVDGQYTATVGTFDVPVGTIVTYVGLRQTDGTFLDSVSIPPQDFTAAQGTLNLTGITYTQS
ncbi:MAG: hypothetical protein HOV97_05035 [Nonomuraea sp.]|nr:hypothetical protein [Nonomuraea sp.]